MTFNIYALRADASDVYEPREAQREVSRQVDICFSSCLFHIAARPDSYAKMRSAVAGFGLG
jgi:hypothetical protein